MEQILMDRKLLESAAEYILDGLEEEIIRVFDLYASDDLDGVDFETELADFETMDFLIQVLGFEKVFACVLRKSSIKEEN